MQSNIPGLVAQLGARTVRIRKVEGSIPFESTMQKASFVYLAKEAFPWIEKFIVLW